MVRKGSTVRVRQWASSGWAWLWRRRLVLATGLAAAIPVVVSTVNAVAAGWLPLGDDAITAVRSFDVLTTHPPLVGPYSIASGLVGKPVQSPGPLLYWLLAVPVRLGEAAPAIAMGTVNTSAVIGAVALARRRGGTALMFATAGGLAVTCGSLEAQTFHDVWGPSAAVLPFALLIFLAWSIACGEHRWLPLAALVGSFVVQTHLTYVLPGAVLLATALGLLLATRPSIPRRWVAATLAVGLVCWSLPIAQEVTHRPGNVEGIVEAATIGHPTLGADAGWHSVARTVGVPPWWLRGPRIPFVRLADVTYAPSAASTATAALALVALAWVALAGLRSRRRELAAAALLALGLMASVALVAARTPSADFSVVAYTLWWASPAGMFAWLVLAFAAARAARARLPARIPAAPARIPARIPAAAALLAVAAVGGVVAEHGKPDRLEPEFKPARTIAARVGETPPGGTLLVTGPRTFDGLDVEGVVAYALRRGGLRFVTSILPGIGTRYDPGAHPHARRMEVVMLPRPGQLRGRVIARVLLGGPRDAPAPLRAPRPVVVTLALQGRP